jgi:hypothetical protein
VRRFHLYFGTAIVIVFLLTGQYMEYVHNRTLPDGPRLLYRSRHIYLLLAGLINLSIGAYLSYRPIGWRGTIQAIGSALLAAGPALLLIGFFREPSRGPNQTMLAPIGIFVTTLGTMLHVVSISRRKSTGGTGNDE